jgi:hypothetical protein
MELDVGLAAIIIGLIGILISIIAGIIKLEHRLTKIESKLHELDEFYITVKNMAFSDFFERNKVKERGKVKKR